MDFFGGETSEVNTTTPIIFTQNQQRVNIYPFANPVQQLFTCNSHKLHQAGCYGLVFQHILKTSKQESTSGRLDLLLT